MPENITCLWSLVPERPRWIIKTQQLVECKWNLPLEKNHSLVRCFAHEPFQAWVTSHIIHSISTTDVLCPSSFIGTSIKCFVCHDCPERYDNRMVSINEDCSNCYVSPNEHFDSYYRQIFLFIVLESLGNTFSFLIRLNTEEECFPNSNSKFSQVKCQPSAK